MVIMFVDLKWEFDMFFFNSGFERYWKFMEGIVVVFFNLIIMFF